MLMLELHALRAELQSTLDRLGIEAANSDVDISTTNEQESSIAPETAETRRNSRHSNRRRPLTRWNRRQLTRELAAASQRRQELEIQLQREMDRDRQENYTQERDRESQNSRRTEWQAAISELQQQREEIMRQIQQDTAADAADAEQVDAIQDTQQRHENSRQGPSPPLVENNESVAQYSIGGVVTLEPLSSSQQLQLSASTSFLRPVAAAPAPTHVPTTIPPSLLDGYPRFRTTPDALNDVFSLQLKFAETMLKLEKSVQVRDQLLQHGVTSLPKQRNRDEHHQVHYRGGRRSRVESGSNSDTSVRRRRESHSSESFSSSAYSFSSLDSTPHRGQIVRVRYPNFGVSRATTAETLAPSSLGADNSPGSQTMDRKVDVMNSTKSPSTIDEAGEDRDGLGDTTDEQEEATHKTPTSGSSVTTPTTGSDQKSNTSMSKQVRFGDDAYSTPVLARKFNFDGPSIDEDDYEEKEEEVESVLSFLDGSSVASAELNDASFLQAFDRFRRELNVSRHDSVTQSLVAPPIARKLFPAPSSSNEAGYQANTVKPTSVAEDDDHFAAFPELDGLSMEELQEHHRLLCLDIQAESAQLVLNFGAKQSVSVTQDAEQTKARLLALRGKLKAVDFRLSEQ
ncbi:hypothetical protein P3T76_005088 [Phytophthora citrophthora]|uniref:Uncharacterized protein n=1 Tax=Phytophthora citrophthora TaxID=4793 RepID=A0AAD9GS46_9STRA|nr:hypothetical protein P3T76_005088 [Phytophthora citrophthora]